MRIFNTASLVSLITLASGCAEWRGTSNHSHRGGNSSRDVTIHFDRSEGLSLTHATTDLNFINASVFLFCDFNDGQGYIAQSDKFIDLKNPDDGLITFFTNNAAECQVRVEEFTLEDSQGNQKIYFINDPALEDFSEGNRVEFQLDAFALTAESRFFLKVKQQLPQSLGDTDNLGAHFSFAEIRKDEFEGGDMVSSRIDPVTIDGDFAPQLSIVSADFTLDESDGVSDDVDSIKLTIKISCDGDFSLAELTCAEQSLEGLDMELKIKNSDAAGFMGAFPAILFAADGTITLDFSLADLFGSTPSDQEAATLLQDLENGDSKLKLVIKNSDSDSKFKAKISF